MLTIGDFNSFWGFFGTPCILKLKYLFSMNAVSIEYVSTNFEIQQEIPLVLY